ncbi:hypothetical protein ACJIZ3_001371 [Penstemon smallii]|uniref:Uncharacterized protein n=1 Tax=Penstemon smallii TaxID=265156 RepID=A0ABD3U5W1_9LAMI
MVIGALAFTPPSTNAKQDTLGRTLTNASTPRNERSQRRPHHRCCSKKPDREKIEDETQNGKLVVEVKQLVYARILQILEHFVGYCFLVVEMKVHKRKGSEE